MAIFRPHCALVIHFSERIVVEEAEFIEAVRQVASDVEIGHACNGNPEGSRRPVWHPIFRALPL